jgi:hypothetical protein
VQYRRLAVGYIELPDRRGDAANADTAVVVKLLHLGFEPAIAAQGLHQRQTPAHRRADDFHRQIAQRQADKRLGLGRIERDGEGRGSGNGGHRDRSCEMSRNSPDGCVYVA